MSASLDGQWYAGKLCATCRAKGRLRRTFEAGRKLISFARVANRAVVGNSTWHWRGPPGRFSMEKRKALGEQRVDL
jgi:hypothetical protein